MSYSETPVKEERRGDVRVRVYYSEGEASPCQDWDMGCRLYAAGRGNAGWDNTEEDYPECCSWADMLLGLIDKYVTNESLLAALKAGKGEASRIAYMQKDGEEGFYGDDFKAVFENMEDRYGLRIMRDGCSDEHDSIANLVEEYMTEHEALMLLLDCHHADVVITDETFNYDNQYVPMVAVCDKARYEEFGGAAAEGWQVDAEKICRTDAKTQRQWCEGDVYRFEAEALVKYEGYKLPGELDMIWSHDLEVPMEQWVAVDSCCGYYDEPQEIIDEVFGQLLK